MDNINFDVESAYLINESENLNSLEKKLEKDPKMLNNKSKINSSIEFTLSNPIFTEMQNFNLSKDDIYYEFAISYKNEKWVIKRSFSEIKNLINTLKNLNFVFINENYFNTINVNSSLNIREVNTNILDFLRYINYRSDILANIITRDFFGFDKCSEPNELINLIKRENLEQIYNFKIEESDMTLSDFLYNPELGLLIIGLEDISYLSRIGRFWSLVDYEILGNLFIFQRVFDSENRPYFRKSIAKNFDARVSKIELNLSQNKIYVGMENGTVQILNINIVDQNLYQNNKENNNSRSNEKIISIWEGNTFHYLNDRITGLQCYSDFLFISSKDNKLIILDTNKSVPEIKFNGSLKKRIAGKGHIVNIKIDPILKKIFVMTVTDKILIFDIITYNNFDSNSESSLDIKIEFFNEIETKSKIKNTFIKGSSIFIALENKLQIFTLGKENEINENTIPLDGSLEEGLSYSSKFINIDYTNYISSVCFFTDMKLIVIGLINGTLIAFNSRSLEIIFARKISNYALNDLVLLEDNYIVISGDEKGNVYFFKFGI